MSAARTAITPAGQRFDGQDRERNYLGAVMNDLLYIGLTIVIFALLGLLVKGIERLER